MSKEESTVSGGTNGGFVHVLFAVVLASAALYFARVVLEPMVGGRHYEDWGDDAGHLYGQVTAYDPPKRWATRGQLGQGVILDSEYELTEEPGAVLLRVTKVAVGPMSEDEAASVTKHGDYRGYGTAIEKLATG